MVHSLSMSPMGTRQDLGIFPTWQTVLSLETYEQDAVHGKRGEEGTAEFSSRLVVMLWGDFQFCSFSSIGVGRSEEQCS